MKLRDDIDLQTSDFWYDLTDGAYVLPEYILQDQEDIDKVKAAVALLMDFRDLLDNAGHID